MSALTRGSPPRWLLWAFAAALNLIWAASYPISKLVMTGVPPLGLTAWMTVVSTLVLLPLARGFPAGWTKDAAWIAVMGAVGLAAASALQFLGTARTAAANVSLIVGLEPLAVALMASVLIKESLTPRSAAAFLLALAGVALITVDPSSLEMRGRLEGNLMVLASVLCYAVYTVGGRVLAARWEPCTLTMLSFAAAAVVFVPAYALLDPAGMKRSLSLTWSEAAGIAFLTVFAAAVGYAGWNWLLKWVTAGELSFSIYLQPVAGAALSWWILGEPLSGTFFAGTALVLGAVALESARPAAPRPPRARGYRSGGE